MTKPNQPQQVEDRWFTFLHLFALDFEKLDSDNNRVVALRKAEKRIKDALTTARIDEVKRMWAGDKEFDESNPYIPQVVKDRLADLKAQRQSDE